MVVPIWRQDICSYHDEAGRLLRAIGALLVDNRETYFAVTWPTQVPMMYLRKSREQGSVPNNYVPHEYMTKMRKLWDILQLRFQMRNLATEAGISGRDK